MTSQIDNFFADLEEQISQVTRKETLSGRKGAIAKQMKDRRISDERKQTLRAELSSISAQLQEIAWQTKANVALFVYQSCDCGEEHKFFEHLMRRQVTTSKPMVERWQKTEHLLNDFPNEVTYRFRQVRHCSSCINLAGFDMAAGVVRIADQGEHSMIPLREFVAQINEDKL